MLKVVIFSSPGYVHLRFDQPHGLAIHPARWLAEVILAGQRVADQAADLAAEWPGATSRVAHAATLRRQSAPCGTQMQQDVEEDDRKPGCTTALPRVTTTTFIDGKPLLEND